MLGTCKLCLSDNQELQKSHFVSRKLYYSGGKPLEFVMGSEVGFKPAELAAPLLCRRCEERFSRRGEEEVLKHVKPKYVLKRMPLSNLMAVAWSRDSDPTATRFDARDFNIDTEKFAYFALSVVWRRAVHEWNKDIPRWELGRFAEIMRRYLADEDAPFPQHTVVIVMVCSDQSPRRTWSVPHEARDNLGCLDFAFDVRGIRFRVMMGQVPAAYRSMNIKAPYCPILYADCQRRQDEAWRLIRQRAGEDSQARRSGVTS